MSSEKSLRIVIPAAIRDEWDEFCARKRIKQQNAVEAMMTWIIGQDDLVQSMILGQIERSPELISLILDRLPSRRDAHATYPKQVAQSRKTSRDPK